MFTDIDARDRVASYARNLAKFVDIAGKPTAGVRMDIPDHLQGVHKTLLQYGHAMRNKHGKNPDFKRNVRYDDAGMTLVLDMKLPGRVDWITVPYTRALEDRKQSAARAQYDDDLLSSYKKGHDDQQALEQDQEEQANGSGPFTPGGTVTSFSYRAPRTNK